MYTKATISYYDLNNIQDCITGSVKKNDNNQVIIHNLNIMDSYKSLRFYKNIKQGKILKQNSDIQHIDIIDCNFWNYDYEVYFLLPNKDTEKKNEMVISGSYNKNTHIFEDRVKIETENTFVQLIYNRDTNEWEIDHKLIPKNSEYKFKLYQTDFGSYMFYLNSDSKISNLMVNSDNIQQKI